MTSRRTRIARAALALFAAVGTLTADRARAGPPGEDVTSPGRDRPTADDSKSKWRASKPFWVDAGVGWQRLNMTTVRVDRNAAGDALTADLVPQVVDGPTAHLGVGVRFLPLTVGVRAGVAAFQDSSPARSVNGMQLYSIDAELGVRIPVARFEPYLLVGGGYSAFGGLGDAVTGVSRGLAVDGANVRGGLGLDFYVSPLLSLGARFTGELLFLSRPGVPIRDLATAQQVSTIGEAKARLLEADGSSIGTALNLTVGPALHF